MLGRSLDMNISNLEWVFQREKVNYITGYEMKKVFLLTNIPFLLYLWIKLKFHDFFVLKRPQNVERKMIQSSNVEKVLSISFQ